MSVLGQNKISKQKRSAFFGFDLRIAIVMGFALHWTWVWVGFWSSAFYSISPSLPDATSGPLSLEPLWTLSILTNVIGYLALFFLSRKYLLFGVNPALPLFAAIATMVGTFMVSTPPAAPLGDVGSYSYIVGALLTGFGSALEVILWAELLCILGARQTIVYSVLATIAGSIFYFIITFLPDQPARFIATVLPAVEMWLFVRCKDIMQSARITSNSSDVSHKKQAKSAESKALKKSVIGIVGISLFFGLSYGVMKGFFVLESESLIALRDYLNIGALILGAIAILTTTRVFRMDFRHMTYQVALPLMAFGFICISLDYPFNLAGFAAHQLGYQYFYIIIWALWAILARKFGLPAARIASASMAAIMTGQLLGSIIGALLITNFTSSHDIAVIAACSVFIILLVALFAFEGPFPGSGWGIFHPLAQESKTPKFKQSLNKLAELRGLSPRETEVFMLLAKGRNSSSIGKQLVISDETAKTHIKRIYRKFGVHSLQTLLDMIEFESKAD